ncbi:MAG TPA: hypothetical protein VH724_01120 [Candidatus Angelobacter sp.]|jgi:hypothetical protein|nr:hypothetical protein [Candidatus Angelobacter sp.]
MQRILKLIVWGLVLTALLPQAGFAQGNGKGKGHNKHTDQDGDDDRGPSRDDKGGIRIVFSVHDRDVIQRYYQDRNSNLPPGLAKRNGNLPPGLQKHLDRDGTLPPGLQKRVQPFPDDLDRRLPQLPDTYRRVTLGVDILILDRRTQRIVDIVHDILRP